MANVFTWLTALPDAVVYYFRHKRAVRDLQWNRDMMDAAMAQLDLDLKEARHDSLP